MATFAEVTPAVCPGFVATLHFSQYVTGVYFLGFERYLSTLFDLSMMSWR
jgi:hypothetical protein